MECDIWSWGVMLCELVGGFNPFTSNNIQATFENIISLNINWPKNISNQCKNLLQSIFVIDPNDRATISDIKKNQFFRNIQSWENLDSFVSNDLHQQLRRQLNEIEKK